MKQTLLTLQHYLKNKDVSLSNKATLLLARLNRAGFGSIEVVQHPEAALAMVEASGVTPPPGVENLMSVAITAVK